LSSFQGKRPNIDEMIHWHFNFRPLIVQILLVFTVVSLSAKKTVICSSNIVLPENNARVSEKGVSARQVSIDKISNKVQILALRKDLTGLINLADRLQDSIRINKPDSSIVAQLYYYTGVCFLIAGKYDNAILNLIRSADIKERLKDIDQEYSKAIYNTGVAYNYLGDFIRVDKYMQKYIDVSVELYGEDSPEAASAYATLIGASIGSNKYDNFKDYTRKALDILSRNDKAFTGRDLSNLYTSIGTGYVRMDDYAKARIYFEQAESVIEKNKIKPDHNYITLVNSLAITYGFLGLPDKEEEYFNKGIKLAVADNSYLAFNMINSFAIGLGNSGNIKRGEYLLYGLLERSEKAYGTGSRYYIEVLKNYAEYLMNFKKDTENSVRLYSVCRDYLLNHEEDAGLRDQVLSGYALALFQNGQPENALEKIQELLFHGKKPDSLLSRYANPDADSIRTDITYLRILRSKYEILWDIYRNKQEHEILEAAANTSELIVSIIDKIRINISEEESRIVLGNRYRDSYINAIRDFELCYKNTGERRYLEKAFEFTEKSKVAGLLAATRELNAIQLHIPPAIAELERSLQREIGFYNSKIFTENDSEKPDRTLLTAWKEKLLVAVKARDSLVLAFEKYYPDYFALKYNTMAPEMKDIPSIVGRNCNYINYIVADSIMYIFLINRKYQELLTVRTDSLLMKNIKDFRILLSDYSHAENARSGFMDYQQIGYELYRVLIEPISEYFISDDLLISPDNILSYLPFETILTSKYTGEGILYRGLDYLMNDYNISYTYSATFMREMVNRNYTRMRNLVAFAPAYTSTLNLDSIYAKRQTMSGFVSDLPYARQEAEFVTRISGGSLYLNDEARESVFKSVAGEYDIIHLAMHTYLNDQNPMNSAMIFSQVPDTPEDGLLHTYEVYGIPLKTRMVVLSSCNTGSGVLTTGEGILSLARGFLYAGSQSVVMSMWEIEDKSGTDVIKLFYKNLKKGKSKSIALRKSRSEYLKKASQLKAHPYFWSTLVVYGDNAPVYFPAGKVIIIACFVLISGVLILFYFWKRKYS
jgi:CHAT domain-containing protein